MNPESVLPLLLLLDDDARLLSGWRRMVRGLPLRLVAVSTVAEANAEIGREVPSVVVSDYQLGGEVDGLSFLAAVRERNPLVVCYLSTGTNRALPPGAGIGMLAKPVQAGDLAKVLESIGRRRQGM